LIVQDNRTHLLKPITRALVIALAVTLTLVTQSMAQTDVATSPAESDVFGPNEPQRALKSDKVVRAIRIASPPTIDGRLDDEPWIVAPAATDLTQRDPENGSAMTRATRGQPDVRSALRQLPVVSFTPHRTLTGATLDAGHRSAGGRSTC
jgi:hypothetical protein